MNKYIPHLDPKTGQFLRTPEGTKTPKMLAMEEYLGVKFEEDYTEKYLEGDLGQKRFAQRWGASKGLIFSNNLRGGRRSWVQMLKLKKKNSVVFIPANQTVLPSCEICNEQFPSLDKAHWKENAKGGTTRSDNILNLCPNCHRKLDRGNEDVVEKGRMRLLFREVSKLFQAKVTNETPSILLELCSRVINERK